MFTEVGRQPWVVFGLLLTRNAVSPSVPAWTVALSLTAFTLLYGVLAGVTGYLMAAVVRSESHDPTSSGSGDLHAAESSLATIY
jgi:cytochrome d ubiquinol oxidase subunit I